MTNQNIKDDYVKRYAYSYEFTNGDKGTWLTYVKPENSEVELMERFPGREIKKIEMLNRDDE